MSPISQALRSLAFATNLSYFNPSKDLGNSPFMAMTANNTTSCSRGGRISAWMRELCSSLASSTSYSQFRDTISKGIYKLLDILLFPSLSTLALLGGYKTVILSTNSLKSIELSTKLESTFKNNCMRRCVLTMLIFLL
jgi:hypothetical protein